MARTRKKKGSSKKPKTGFSVDFDLEDDAEDIFLKYLEDNGIPDKDNLSLPSESSQSKKRRKLRGKNSIIIDLHGLTVAEALTEIEDRIESIRSPNLHLNLKIITGKGLHSGPSGGVLSSEVYAFVMDRYGHYIVKIDDPPHSLKIYGIPIRGHFEVEMKF